MQLWSNKNFHCAEQLGWPDTWVGGKGVNQAQFATEVRLIFISKILA